MDHVVFFAAAGGSAFRRVPSLADAVAFVEHLRNAEGIEDVAVYALTPVPMSFRAYYRVEVPAAPEGTAGQPGAAGQGAGPVPAEAAATPALTVPSVRAMPTAAGATTVQPAVTVAPHVGSPSVPEPAAEERPVLLQAVQAVDAQAVLGPSALHDEGRQPPVAEQPAAQPPVAEPPAAQPPAAEPHEVSQADEVPQGHAAPEAHADEQAPAGQERPADPVPQPGPRPTEPETELQPPAVPAPATVLPEQPARPEPSHRPRGIGLFTRA